MTKGRPGELEPTERYVSWGRVHRYRHRIFRPRFADETVTAFAKAQGTSLLAFGMGRSYGDVCLNDERVLVDMRGLDRILGFNDETGEIDCEAGVTLDRILNRATRPVGGGRRWFLPVTPGTKYVTVGGAIANDVHGKNHHRAGCFGNHILSLRLLRSNGDLVDCDRERNTELFQATIGGMGLTGIITSAKIRLLAVPGLALEVEDVRFDNLDAFFALADRSVSNWEYTVAWVDGLARGDRLGRGIFTRARHVADDGAASRARRRLTLPVEAPPFLLNGWTVGAFNAVHWRRARRHPRLRIDHWDPVFYPLDRINNWNLMYGPRGFFQYQCALPTATARDAVRAILVDVAKARAASFLAVLKTFGSLASPGLMSFPIPGATLALDLPNGGNETLTLLERLDRITEEAGGRIYPAKDGRVSAANFQKAYPNWPAFARQIDPACSSSFWRRVGQQNDMSRRSAAE